MSDNLTNFQFIFTYIVEPVIDEIESTVDVDFKKKFVFRRNDLELIRDRCENFYQEKREDLKKLFYGNKYTKEHAEDKKYCLDLHKIASIICYSLIKYKVFVFDSDKVNEHLNSLSGDTTLKTDWIIDNVLVNYKLAFNFSIAFIYYKMLFDATNNGDEELARKIQTQRGLSLYKEHSNNEVIKRHESFKNSVILDFFKRDVKGRSFDYFMYATVLFQIEEYNKIIFKNCS